MARWSPAAVVVLLAFAPALAGAAPRADGSVPAPAHVVQLVTHVPVSTLNDVGVGTIAPPQFFPVARLKGHLTSQRKPEVLSISLAWCPHCAASNWALAVALSRFGTFSGLRVINTGRYFCKLAHDPCSLQPFPCLPFTEGISFFGTGYRSRYVSFVDVVEQDVHGHKLQKPTRREKRALNPFDRTQQAPAVDVGGRYGFLGVPFDPALLRHRTWTQIAMGLANPRKGLARAIDGLANLFTASICKVTNGRPGAVCNSSGVRAADAAYLQ